ncbi:VOC family protein [Lentibacillus sp. JNUCC-1]|uniref:VOC family protein n=1 Tax=Lentibacillus sp. JNUCC-1 TaxID=2654513 RepID=UPI0012E94D74|nr:VOC family protein [Lentibacillus sp. JNUCC-1]
MSIRLDHTVIYAKDHKKAAREFADVMGVRVGRIAGPGYDFSAVQVNNELSIYFMERDQISLEQHMAFDVDGRTFDRILKQLKKQDIAYGSSPFDRENMRTDHDFAPRGLFWTNVDGCLFEIMTFGF